jgi:hypothetical protein
MDIYQAINQCDFSLFRNSFDRKLVAKVFPLKEVTLKLNSLFKRFLCTDQFIDAEQPVLNGFVSKVQCLVAMLQLIRSDRQFNMAPEDFPHLLADEAFRSPFLIFALLNAATSDPADVLSARADVLEGILRKEDEDNADPVRRLWLALSQSLDLLTQAVDILGRNNFKPPVVLAQHLMALSVVLDKPRLFRVASLVTEVVDKDDGDATAAVFAGGVLFYDWFLTLSGLEDRSDFQVPLAAALTRRSLGEEKTPEIHYEHVSLETLRLCDSIFGSKVANALRKKTEARAARKGRRAHALVNDSDEEGTNNHGEIDADKFLDHVRRVALRNARKVKT